MEIAGERRLEIRSDGLGQTIFMDFHSSCDCGIGGNNSASADTVRRSRSHRHPVIRNSLDHCQTTHRSDALRDTPIASSSRPKLVNRKSDGFGLTLIMSHGST